MRLARVVGKVTLSRRLAELPAGSLLLVEPLDVDGVANLEGPSRQTPTDSALVVYDELGAGEDSVIAISEGREASMPWWPAHVPLDAYCVAMIDNVNVKREFMSK
jgi:microcompartment protein CcmK/EutM